VRKQELGNGRTVMIAVITQSLLNAHVMHICRAQHSTKQRDLPANLVGILVIITGAW